MTALATNPVPRPAWPGLDAGVTAAMQQVRRGVQPNPAAFSVEQVCLYHRKAITGSATTHKFFEDVTTYAPPETNWTAQGIRQNQGFWATHFGFSIEPNISVAGAAVTNGELLIATAAAPFTNAEEIRAVTQAGNIIGKIGQQQFISGWGLHSFPAGGGIVGDVEGVAAAAGAIAGVTLNNGVPSIDNRYELEPWTLFLPGEALSVGWTVHTARTVTAAFVVTCRIWGKLVRKANR